MPAAAKATLYPSRHVREIIVDYRCIADITDPNFPAGTQAKEGSVRKQKGQA